MKALMKAAKRNNNHYATAKKERHEDMLSQSMVNPLTYKRYVDTVETPSPDQP